MSEKNNAQDNQEKPMIYKFRIKGHLGRQWTDWFEGMTISQEEPDTTVLVGAVIDQSALHGLLKKVRDLGVTLLSVDCIEECPDETNLTE